MLQRAGRRTLVYIDLRILFSFSQLEPGYILVASPVEHDTVIIRAHEVYAVAAIDRKRTAPIRTVPGLVPLAS